MLFIFILFVVVALYVCVIATFSFILLLPDLLTLLYFFLLIFFKLFFHFPSFYSLESRYSSFSNSLFYRSLSYCLLPLSTISTYSYLHLGLLQCYVPQRVKLSHFNTV